MKLCVFGAGAIGGYLAVELACAGNAVCVVARGEHLQAIQANGLKLISGAGEKLVRVPASDEPRTFGEQDVVFCTLKAHQAYESAAALSSLLGSHTVIVTAMNGIPWWYFYKAGGELEGHHLNSVDPDARQWTLLGPQRAIGCVVDPACEVLSPGVIVHREFNRFTLGEPDGSRSKRVLSLAGLMTEAGFDAPVRDAIRWNIWLKLWGNVCFNPVSALTGATLDRVTSEPSLRRLCASMMTETRAVNEALGVHIPANMMERRLNAAGRAIGHKISMLQDLERGRSLEIDALVTAVHELGVLTSVHTPTLDAILALIQERGRNLGLYTPLR